MAPSNVQQTRIEFDHRVPMRDGIALSADIYFPADPAKEAGKWPIVLLRTPYVKANVHVLEAGKYYAEHSYIFVAMDVRGRGDSDGEFVPYFNDGQDGYDAIEW